MNGVPGAGTERTGEPDTLQAGLVWPVTDKEANVMLTPFRSNAAGSISARGSSSCGKCLGLFVS